MVDKPRPGRKARVPYKVTVALFAHEWDELRMEAQARKIEGGQLISAILSKYVADMGPVTDAPLPEEAPADA